MNIKLIIFRRSFLTVEWRYFTEDTELQCVRKNARESFSTNEHTHKPWNHPCGCTKKEKQPIFVGLELKSNLGVGIGTFEGLVTALVVNRWVTATIPYSKAKMLSKPAFKLNNPCQEQNVWVYGYIPATEVFRWINEKTRCGFRWIDE